MDLDQRLSELGRKKQQEALTDQQQMERLKQAIRRNIPQRTAYRRWMPVPLVLGLVFIIFGAWVYLPGEYLDEGRMPASLPHVQPNTTPPSSESPIPSDTESKNKESKQSLVLDERFAFAVDFVDWMQSYTDYEIKQVTDSPFAHVFETTDQAVMLDTNKGKLHVVFFPNPGEAEKVEIDEDFTVRGQITFTFTGAKLKDGATPLHATGPTYQYSYDNLLFLSSNSDFVLTFRNVFSNFDMYRSIFANFGLNSDEYTYLNEFKQEKIKVSFEDIDQNPALAIHKLSSFWWAKPGFKEKPYVPKVGDRRPGVFVKNGTVDEAISIHLAADGIHHLFRLKWDNTQKLWAPIDHQQKPGKSIQRSS